MMYNNKYDALGNLLPEWRWKLMEELEYVHAHQGPRRDDNGQALWDPLVSPKPQLIMRKDNKTGEHRLETEHEAKMRVKKELRNG